MTAKSNPGKVVPVLNPIPTRLHSAAVAGRRESRERLSRAITERVEEQIRRSVSGRPPLPDGVVTIMFTDVEGSSEMVSALGDERARAVLRRHEEEIRKAIDSHHGVEVERAGDSFMAAFRLPRHALACAFAVHSALSAAPSDPPVRVRIGMDTGEAIAEDRAYFGLTVFRASRIAALAAGGQIFVSEATRVLGEPAGFSFRDLGEHELRGLGRGHRIFEAVAGAPSRE